MDEANVAQAVNAHYGLERLSEAILNGLRTAGKDPEAPTVDDLAPVDHFHTGGKAATVELAHMVPVHADMEVLDVGGGIGGAARLLASQFGCRVAVVDLTETFCQVGEMLTRRTGLSGRVRFRTGDALNLPFEDHCFDLVWTQHATMNIADKSRLYSEFRRVLRPGGRLAFHEITAGPNAPLAFPVPWASVPALSFLSPPDELRELLGRTGWIERAWVDRTAASLAFFQERVPRGPVAPPPLGIHLLLGQHFPEAIRNMVHNLAEQRITVIQAVLERA